MTTPVRRMLHEGRPFLALYRQRGCVPFRQKRKGHSGRKIRPLCKFSERIVLKTLDLTGAGHPSWVSRAHSSFPSSEKQDARHLSKSEFETVLSGLECVKRPVEDGLLADDGGDRSDLWHLQNGGIKATEKATQKIREFCLMTELSNFFTFLVYKCPLSVLIGERQICSAIGAWLSWPQPYRLTRTQRSVYDYESI